MKKKNPFNLCIVVLFFLLSYYSCIPGKVSNPILLRADSLMECCADSALLLLQCIEYPQKMKKSERAFYALLRTKAEDKNYIEHTSDSLIKTAFDYYQRYGTTYQKMESWYYLASVYRDLGDAPRAIDYFQRAAETSKKKTEHELLCRTYLQMGTLFFYQKLPKEGVDAYKKSHHHALLTNDSLRLANSYIVMARVYTEVDNVDSTLYYYKEAANIARETENKRLEYITKSELAGIYLQLDRVEEARKLLVNSKEDGADYKMWGDLHRKSGNLDSAKHYYREALRVGSLYIKRTANKELYQMAKNYGQEKEIIYYLEQYVLYEDSVRSITDTEGVKRVESLYAYQYIENENNRLLLENKAKKYIIYVASSIIALFLGAVFWFFLNYRIRKSVRIEKKMRISLVKKTKSQTGNDFRSSDIYQLLHKNCGNPKFKMNGHWEELQEQINASYNNFTGNLYMLHPKLSEAELQISLLIKAEIPLKDIARLLHKEKNTISNTRKRLYEKIHGDVGKAEQWDEFILGL